MGKNKGKKMKGTTLSLGELAQALGAPADPVVASLPTAPRFVFGFSFFQMFVLNFVVKLLNF